MKSISFLLIIQLYIPTAFTSNTSSPNKAITPSTKNRQGFGFFSETKTEQKKKPMDEVVLILTLKDIERYKEKTLEKKQSPPKILNNEQQNKN